MTEFSEDCRECGVSMKIIRREKELAECDINDMTEGEMADYMVLKCQVITETGKSML